MSGRKDRLLVDWPRCKGHGSCAEAFPEGISLDLWGFPVVTSGAVPSYLIAHARRAVAVCPESALRLVTDEEAPRRSAPARTITPWP